MKCRVNTNDGEYECTGHSPVEQESDSGFKCSLDELPHQAAGLRRVLCSHPWSMTEAGSTSGDGTYPHARIAGGCPRIRARAWLSMSKSSKGWANGCYSFRFFLFNLAPLSCPTISIAMEGELRGRLQLGFRRPEKFCVTSKQQQQEIEKNARPRRCLQMTRCRCSFGRRRS